jgi:hypothetical protein
MNIVDLHSRRGVSRDFISGASDGIAPETPIRAVSHDFAGHHTSQTLRDRKRLGRLRQLQHSPLDGSQLTRRTLKTEFNGGLMLGFVFGAFFSTMSLALSFPYWAPVVAWMARP